MSARVVVLGREIELRDADALAAGGEAVVYAHGAHAIKLWHAPTPARVRKVEALVALRATLPAALVGPEDVARDAATGEPVGFAMPRLPDAWQPIALLGLPSWRRPRGLGLGQAAAVMVALSEALTELHAAGIVLGDLSDQNVLCDATAADPVRIVDADSVQFGDLPCDVATEAFLDPALYGPDLRDPCATGDGRPRRFSPRSDRYAWAVLAFRLATLVHPYGGALARLPSLARRAAARASVLRADVVVPDRVREAMELLPRDLRAAFEAVFERGEQADLSGLVSAWGRSLLSCGCGLEIPAERLPCPRCTSPTRQVAVRATAGAFSADVVLEARGAVVAVAARSDAILAVAIERFSPVLYVARPGGIERYPLASGGAGAWDVALGPFAVAVAPRGGEGDAPLTVGALGARGAPSLAALTTERVRGEASLAVAEDVVFRLARGTVLAGRVRGGEFVERVVATVPSRRTLLFGASVAGAPVAIAVGAALGAPRVALLTERGATDVEVPALAPGESIVEVSGLGDGEGGVVLLRTALGGRALVRTIRFDARGAVRSSRVAPEEARGAGPSVRGVAQRGAMLASTDAGLVREDLQSGASTLLAGTERFVERGAPIALAPGGLVAALGRTVSRLRAT